MYVAVHVCVCIYMCDGECICVHMYLQMYRHTVHLYICVYVGRYIHINIITNYYIHLLYYKFTIV